MHKHGYSSGLKLAESGTDLWVCGHADYKHRNYLSAYRKVDRFKPLGAVLALVLFVGEVYAVGFHKRPAAKHYTLCAYPTGNAAIIFVNTVVDLFQKILVTERHIIERI